MKLTKNQIIIIVIILIIFVIYILNKKKEHAGNNESKRTETTSDNNINANNITANNITGNLRGDVSGNVTGNLRGDVSGNVTGNLLNGNYRLVIEEGKLYLYNGNKKLLIRNALDFKSAINGVCRTETNLMPRASPVIKTQSKDDCEQICYKDDNCLGYSFSAHNNDNLCQVFNAAISTLPASRGYTNQPLNKGFPPNETRWKCYIRNT